MENLIIQYGKEDFDTPSVNLNAGAGICNLEGESYLEKTAEFYDRILLWLDRYINEIDEPLTFNFRLTYFNTSSSKRILYIMLKLKEYQDKGGKVTANWYYDKNDIDMQEDIEDLMMISKLDVNMITDPNLKFNPFDRPQKK